MTPPLSVWGPRAQTVVLDVPPGRRSMARDDRGWWRSRAPYEGPYRFIVDGEPLPDPRSPWQPAGIRGPSHTVRHDRFAWTDRAWTGRPLAASVLYELHVGTFTPEGTFDAVVGRLDHLVELGVDTVELMPVAEFPGTRGWGYDGVLLFAPHHAYGGPDGLKRLVDACHRRGIAVVLDVVYNHLGPSGNHLDRYGPYFTDRYATPWGPAVNLDGPGSDEVRRFLCDNALSWLRDYHIDGLRLDAVHAFHDHSALHVLEQLAREVEQLARASGRTLWLIAESDLGDPIFVRNRDAHGYGLDAQWSDDFHHAMHAALTGERNGYYADFGSLSHVGIALERTFVYAGQRSAYRSRHHGRVPLGLPQHRFVAYIQNHDQVGNRARGERLSALVDRSDLFAAAALLICSPFTPLLFQGEEWAATTPFLYFTDHDDPAVGRDIGEARRAEFAAFSWAEEVPDPQAVTSYTRSKLDWAERGTAAHREMLDWYARLIRVRRALVHAIVGREDDTTVEVDDDRRAVVMRRGPLVVVCNIGPHPMTRVMPDLVVLAARGGCNYHDGVAELDPCTTVLLGTAALAAEMEVEV